MNQPKHIMRHLYFPLLLTLGILFSLPLRASHIIGGELSYEYLGNDTFKISMDVYRDCFYGIPWFDTPAHFAIFNESGFPVQGISAATLNVQPLFTDTIPNNIAGDPCLFVPSDVCVEHARYEFKVKLSGPGGFYVIYQRCCRNETINNIMNPDQSGATYWIYISPEAKAVNNSSPTFGFYPPVFVCINKPIHHPYAATDINGDSLVYKFYTPFLGGSETYPNPHVGQPPYDESEIMPPPYDTVVWVDPPYNLNQLLGPSSSPLSIDPATGLITGLPVIQGQFVVGVQVEEYRNGVLLSILRRDFQYNVGECAEIEATIIAPPAQCDNLTVQFGNETDVAQDFIWYFDWPNLTPSSTLKEPTFTYPDTGTYTIALIAEPNGECVDTGYHQIFLQYNSLTPNFSWQTFDCANESALVLTDLSVDNVSPPSQWNWVVTYGGMTQTSNVQNPVFIVPNPSSGTITLTVTSLNGCVQTMTANFTAGGNNPINLLPGTVQICQGQSAQLNPNGPTTGFTYQWGPPVPSGQQNMVNPTVTPTVNTTYMVTVTVFNGLCQATGSVSVVVNPLPVLAFQADPDCNALEVNFINQSQNSPAGFRWNFGDPATTTDVSSLPNPTYVYPAYGTYTVTLMTAPGALCKDTISQQITLTEKVLQADFGYDYTNCNEDAVTIQFFDESVNNQFNTVEWLWQFGGVYTGTSTQPNPIITVTQQGTLTVKLTITTDEDCVSATVPQTLNVDLIDLPGLQQDSVLGCLFGGVTLNPGGSSNYFYQWSPATGLSCTTCPSPHANPSQTTTYTVQIANFSGSDTCDVVKTVTVFVPQNVGLVASNDVTTCEPQATLTASASLLPVTWAWFNENNVQVGNTNTITVNVSGYDHYVVRATDMIGCHYYDTISVTGGPADIQTSGDQIKCSDEPLNVFVTNLDPNDTLTYQWTPGSGIMGPTNVPNPNVINTPGEQTFYVEATNQFGCQRMDSVYVAVVDVNMNLDFDYEVECTGSSVEFTNLSTNAFNYVWNFGDPTTNADTSHLDNPTYTYPDTGAYEVFLTIGFDVGCTDTLRKVVEIADIQFAVDFNYTYNECETDFINVQFLDATQFFVPNIDVVSWLWETSNGDVSNLQNPVFTVQEGQEFDVTLTVTTSNDCVGSHEESLKLEFIEVNFSDSIVLCQGDSAFLNPFGDITYEYHWTPNLYIDNPDSPNPKVSPPVSTTYFVEITSLIPDTCSITRTVFVFVPEKIEVDASDDTFTCGQPVSVSAISNVLPTTFTWTDDSGNFVGGNSTLTILPPVDTEYKVVGADQYGCKDSTYVTIDNEEVKITQPLISPECPEVEIQLTVTNNVADHDLSYVWTATPPGQILPPATGNTVTALTAPAGQSATYMVTATNQFGCTKSLTQNIATYNFVPTVQPEILACPGVPTQLNPGANPNLMYNWDPATGLTPNATVPNPTVTITQSATYTVTVSNSFGLESCQEVLQTDVFVPPVIDITETVDTFTCGSPIVISAQANVAPVSLAWFGAQGNPLGTGTTLTVNPQTVETYVVIATDEYNCTENDTVVVSNNQLDLALDGNGVIDTCPMPSYNICITNLDPNDDLTFEWTASNGGQILSGGDTPCPEVSSQQGVVSTFTATVTNQWGCSETKDFEVNTFVFDPVIRDVMTICNNVQTPINPDVNPLTPLSYQWTPHIGLNCYDCPDPEATLSDNQLYTVTILGYNGADTCSLVQTVQVLVNPAIELATQPSDTSICEPTDITISTLTNSNIITGYVWSQNPDFSNPIGTGDMITVTPDETEVYFVEATDTLGCKDTAMVTINAYPIDISLDDYYNFCVENGTLTITVINNDPAQVLDFNWEPKEYIKEEFPGGIVVIEVPDTTVFTVDITNQFGCMLTDSTTVLYYDIEPTIGQISSSEDTIIYNSPEYSQFDIEFDPTYTYEWSPQEGLSDPYIHNPQASPDETTTYTLTVTNEGDCVTQRTVMVVVINPECAEPNIFLPNAFTPNDDGNNDVLYVRSNIIEYMEFAVYNRWGQKVFETTDQNTGWDGTFKGERLTPDVYGIYLKAGCYNGEEFFKKGNVTLLR